MPYINITLAEGSAPEEKRALMAAVARAVHDAIAAPLPSIRVWITEVDVGETSIGGVALDEVRARRAAGDNSL